MDREKVKEVDCFQCGNIYELPKEIARIQTCRNCNVPLCEDCVSDMGQCYRCTDYDLPEEVTVVHPNEHTEPRVHVHGGHMDELPTPHKRFYDDPSKARLITINVSRFYGVGQHYYVDIRIGDNPILNEEGGWQMCWNDPERKEMDQLRWSLTSNFVGRYNTYESAKNATREVIKRFAEHFGKIRVKFCEAENLKWLYKEGDS